MSFFERAGAGAYSGPFGIGLVQFTLKISDQLIRCGELVGTFFATEVSMATYTPLLSTYITDGYMGPYFTAPAVSPLTMWRCASSNTTIAGIAESCRRATPRGPRRATSSLQ